MRRRLAGSEEAPGNYIGIAPTFDRAGTGAFITTDESGDFAERRSIRLGRQNTENYEVLDGLEAGERVVTSSYDTFGDADRLVFK